MPRKTRTRATGWSAEQFLRSINVCYDAEAPERIAHFHPTTKCTALLKALLGEEDDRAYFVVAPYGTGKSLTATYLLHLIENRRPSSAALDRIAKRLRRVSPELGKFATNRRRSKRRGPVLALHGHAPSVAEAVKRAALEAMARLKLGREARPLRKMPADDIDGAVALLAELGRKCREAGCDRIAIVWDEFGRHLESLIAEGRGAALSDIQALAEFVSRSRELPMSLGLLLHQGLLHYAGNMPQSVRNEWKKIEGRFQTLQYIDDSKEIYRLIAEVAASRTDAKPITHKAAREAASTCRRLGLFRDFSQTDLQELLRQVSPLEPVTLYLLPRISARVAQNERTLFSFLYSADLGGPVGPDALYDYFSGSMRSDTAVGGTHRQWLETESALSKVPDDPAALRTLKTACLLGLGTGGERSRTGRELLDLAVTGYDGGRSAEETIKTLIERKLLLHRRHNDEVSIWHGTDLDLRGRLEERRRREAEDFDLVGFLEREAKPPVWKPVEYNDDFCIRRYFTGDYQTVGRLSAYLNTELGLADLPVDCDGNIVYLVAEDAEELRTAEQIACEKLSHERLLVAVPSEPLPLHEAALEVSCLNHMQLDPELVESDPLALPEIQQMTDDARDHLQRLLQKLVTPGPEGPRWFYRGQQLHAESPRDLRKALSEIMRRVYPETPRINNEMIVRKKPSSVVVNARKKLLLGILERHGQENLGITGNFPDASMLRTVLLHPGLYRRDRHGHWRYAAPRAIRDPGLRAVWRKVQQFLTQPADRPKSFRRFFEKLMAPPFGVRAGLIPILLAAGLKAFPSAISITKGDEYVTDILPSDIEQIRREPDAYRLMVLDLDEARLNYLRELHRRFSPVDTYEVAETDLIRQCFDAIEGWKAQLPPAAMTTRRLSKPARKFRDALTRSRDPLDLLFEKIPAACGFPVEDSRRLFAALSHCMEELSGVAALYAEHAAESVRRTVSIGRAADLALGYDLDSAEINVAPMPIEKPFRNSVISRLHCKISIHQRFERQAAVVLGREHLRNTNPLFLVDPENAFVECPVVQLA